MIKNDNVQTKKARQIFIVEDNEIYAMMLDYILSRDTVYEFVNFKSGEECIQNLYRNPDLIILDYALPGINGHTTLLEIKKYNPDIPVIMLSNHNDIRLAEDLISAGADDYIFKQNGGTGQVIEIIEHVLADHNPKKPVSIKEKIKSFVEKILSPV